MLRLVLYVGHNFIIYMFIITIEIGLNKNNIGRQEKVKYKRIIGLQYLFILTFERNKCFLLWGMWCISGRYCSDVGLQQQSDNTEGQ